MSVEDGRVVIDMHGGVAYLLVWQPQNEETLSGEARENLLYQAQVALTRELFTRTNRRAKQERVLRFTERLLEGEGRE